MALCCPGAFLFLWNSLGPYRHKAYYSLDREDGIEHSALFIALSPCEIYERKVTMQELHAAISSLPDKQAKRIYAHFVLGMSKTDIARAEGVDEPFRQIEN